MTDKLTTPTKKSLKMKKLLMDLVTQILEPITEMMKMKTLTTQNMTTRTETSYQSTRMSKTSTTTKKEKNMMRMKHQRTSREQS